VSSERGIFDGESPVSTTTIFDDAIFDTELVEPVGQAFITVFVHGNEQITSLVHGNEVIPRMVS